MDKNKHFGMELKRIWFMKKEYAELIIAIENKDKNLVFNILNKIKERGDM